MTKGPLVRGRRAVAVMASGALVGAAMTVLTGAGAGAASSSGPAGSAVTAAASTAVAAKPNPEKKKRKPDQDLGYYLGHPTPTYQWHGCTQTSTRRAPAPKNSSYDLYAQYPQYAPAKGSKQGKVKYVVVSAPTRDGWVLKWEVKKPAKWKICGVQVTGLFDATGVPYLLAAQAGYTSGAKKGSTATTSAGETWKLKVPKSTPLGWEVPKEAEGKKMTPVAIAAVTVFIAKKKK